MTAPLQPNARVIHRQHPEFGFGTLRYVDEDPFGDVRLQVAFDYLDNLENVAPSELEVMPDILLEATEGAWGDLASFKRKLAAALVISENNLTGGFTKAAVQPLPHQAFLLDKVLSGERFGHILADDVGLGKTIEAGLLITCLMRREPPVRILVICPAGLALQWQDELEDHFGLFFSIMGVNFEGRLPASWHNQTLVIAPLDRIKRDEYRELLKQVGGFDLVVADEAHRLTAKRRFLSRQLEKTANYRLFEFLVASRLIRHVENGDQTPRSPRLLLLSGTPHQGDDERFLHLLHLVRPDLFSLEKPPEAQFQTSALAEALTRTPKSRAVDWEGNPLFKGHVTTTLDVHWTIEESDVSRLLTEYIRKSLDFVRESDRGTQLVVQLVMHTFHTLAASSWPALQRALQRRLDALDGRAQKASELFESTEDEEEDLGDLVLPSTAFFEAERALLATLLERLTSLAKDSKWENCASLLKEIEAVEPGAKVLLFTRFRVTQQMLRDRLVALFPGSEVEVVHGEVDAVDRRSARIRFETSSRFLVSTEAGGEGVNLQKACHLMLNYDLSWNPMRLQQRIGRLDRYGQKHLVRVFNLRVPDSWDQHISTRILERLDVIQRTMGLTGSGLVENYREMILGEIAEQLDVGRLFKESILGKKPDDGTVDSWVREAVSSVERWRELFSPELGMGEDVARLMPSLTSDDFKTAFQLAAAFQGIQLKDTRNSLSQFVPGVFHFELPQAFRDPVFRPSRTLHVAFDRIVYGAVRGQDLGVVRGQPIRPTLCGFGEPFTDWVFQTAMHAKPRESTFSLAAPAECNRPSGWIFVYSLRWLGRARRLAAPDSVAVVFVPEAGEAVLLRPKEAARLLEARAHQSTGLQLPAATATAAKSQAQGALRDIVKGRGGIAAGHSVGLSLLIAAKVESMVEGERSPSG